MRQVFLWVFGLTAVAASAQTTVHKHYEESEEAKKPGPSGEVAPRLQNLVKLTFPVTTKSRQTTINRVGFRLRFNRARRGGPSARPRLGQTAPPANAPGSISAFISITDDARRTSRSPRAQR
jgi:hypothetical protein